MSISLDIRPIRSLVRADDEYFDVLVSLMAKEAPVELSERPNVNLCLVIDRSGSMAGCPIEEAKRAVEAIVHRLDARDLVSVVSYDDEIEIVLEPMSGDKAKDVIRSALTRVYARNMTDLHGGWLKGCQLVAPYLKKFAISRVVVLSDGQTNTGVKDIGEIKRQASSLADTGVVTTTLGLGCSFNELLMTGLAAAGQGNAHYAESADELMGAFDAEFNMLASTLARSVRLRIKDASAELESLNGYELRKDGFVLPNVLAGAESWMIARFKRPRKGWSSGVSFTACGFFDAIEDGEVTGKDATLPMEFKAGVGDGTAVDEVVYARVQELEAAKRQEEVRLQLERGQFEQAKRSLASMSAEFASNAWVSASVANMQALADAQDYGALSKEVAYSTHTMRSRVAEIGEDLKILGPSRYNLRKVSQGKSNF